MDMLALAITDPLIPGAPKLKLPEIIRPRPRTTARRPPCSAELKLPKAYGAINLVLRRRRLFSGGSRILDQGGQI